MFTHFNTLDVPPPERFERWQQRLSDTFQLSFPAGALSERLEAQMWVLMVGGMMLSPRTCGAHTLTRTPHMVRTTQLDHYKLHLRVAAPAARSWRRVTGASRSATIASC